MTHYVVQLDIETTDSTVLDSVETELPDPAGDHAAILDTEHSHDRGTAEETGNPVLRAHVPYETQADADDMYRTIAGLQGVMATAEPGSYAHVHECPTGGTEQDWDCGAHVLAETTA